MNFFTTGRIFYIATAQSSRFYDFIDSIVTIVCINYYYTIARGRTRECIDHTSHSLNNLNGVSSARQSSEIKKGLAKYTSAFKS
jgi:hypothetical protein